MSDPVNKNCQVAQDVRPRGLELALERTGAQMIQSVSQFLLLHCYCYPTALRPYCNIL